MDFLVSVISLHFKLFMEVGFYVFCLMKSPFSFTGMTCMVCMERGNFAFYGTDVLYSYCNFELLGVIPLGQSRCLG